MLWNRGFSLIELLVTVAIAAILAGVAYPSYLEQVRGSRRAECTGGLASLSNAMERHFTVNSSYLGAAQGGADTGAPAVFAVSCPVDGGNPTYNLSIAAATANDLVLVAGKGHEDYQEIAGRREQFSDIERVQEILQGGAA